MAALSVLNPAPAEIGALGLAFGAPYAPAHTGHALGGIHHTSRGTTARASA